RFTADPNPAETRIQTPRSIQVRHPRKTHTKWAPGISIPGKIDPGAINGKIRQTVIILRADVIEGAFVSGPDHFALSVDPLVETVLFRQARNRIEAVEIPLMNRDALPFFKFDGMCGGAHIHIAQRHLSGCSIAKGV